MAYVTLSSKAIGSTIKLKVNGSAKDFIVVHQGKPSSVYDDSCNGTWLLMKDIYENRQWHSSNTNDYANSTIHSYLNSTFLNLFESNIKKGWLTREEADKALVIKKEAAEQKAANMPEQMIQNIAKGRLAKFLKECCLVNQEFQFGDGDKTSVADYLKKQDKDLKIVAYKRFTLVAE